MDRTRSPIARYIAALLAIGGMPFAIVLAILAFKSPISLVILSPGWFAYFALIWTAIGNRLPGDPYTTWIPCMLVNAFWAWGWKADFSFHPQDSIVRYHLHAYVWAAMILGFVGLVIECVRTWKCRPDP